MNIVIFKESNEVRNAKSLELLGHIFIVDKIRYFIPNNNFNKKSYGKKI